ncbi:hypothetical protein OG884_18970 [Streptosporangium sp. NBC_01755]|uniref:hypothetical protein n=1 Tax=Streptosporangium sp. NBC_01755 TaxID=2975949 RepID=UPI002DDAE119|nr:hypothetical protein [Streptosporangium sp. NBC_01755]WSD03892.1 hypothetical protein OG884_18970 [Streptosporangium sp. NBC_01755]
MGATTTSRPRVDWSLKPRGPVSAAGMGALGLATLSLGAGEIAGLSPWWAVGLTSAGVGATLLSGAGTDPRALWYRLSCWAGAGGWLTWTMAAGLDQPEAWPALGVGSLLAGLLAGWANRPPLPGPAATRAGHRASTAMVPRRHIALAEDWLDRIRRVCKVRVEVIEARDWPTKAGFSMLLRLPQGGATIGRLDGHREGLASDADLLDGCGVEFTSAGRRGSCWMHVATVNHLAEDLDHPRDYSPRSVLDGISLGAHRDGSPMRVQVREPRIIVVGTTGSGKTGTLHTITAELGFCVDNLTWQLDLNGGGVSQAWLAAWLAGEVERPAVDWAAPCAEEALLISHAHTVIAKERKTAYSKRRMEANSQLLPIGADVPQITEMLDEGFEVLSQTIRDPIQAAIRDNLEESARIGRNEACQVLVSALRSTSNTLSTDLLALFHNRLIMAGGAQKEIDYFYDYTRGPKVEDLAGPGSGFVRLFGRQEIRAWRCFKMEPGRDIRPASLAISVMRPNLDAPSAAAAGRAYATRHSRMRWLFSTPEDRVHLVRPEPIELPGVTDQRGKPIIWDPALTHPAADAGAAVGGEMEPRPPVQPPAPREAVGSYLKLLKGGTTSGWADPAALVAAARAERIASGQAPMPARPAAPGPVHVEQIHEIRVGAEVLLPELLRRALALPWDEGRLHSEVMAPALGMTEHELAALLGAIGVTRPPNAFERGGRRRRGYERQHLLDAAEAIRSGDLEVPPEVADWPAA